MCDAQVAEAALADEHARGGDRLALQRRSLRLGRPPRRWKQPPWAAQVPADPREVTLTNVYTRALHVRALKTPCLKPSSNRSTYRYICV